MNTNNKITLKTGWSRLEESKRSGVLQALHENIHHVRLRDYINMVSVSCEWREGLSKPGYAQVLRFVYRISTPLVQRFISMGSRIDRSDSLKFDENHEIANYGGAYGGFLPIIVPGAQITQAAYEVRELNRFRSCVMKEYCNDGYSQLQSFEDLSDEDRNGLLDVIRVLKKSRITRRTVELSSIAYLVSRYAKIIEVCPGLDVVINGNILPQVTKHKRKQYYITVVSAIIIAMIMLVASVI